MGNCPSAGGQSESKISEANTGANPAKCTACPELSGGSWPVNRECVRC